METIFAFSTAPGKAGVAVLRISGPKAHEVTKAYCGDLPTSRELRLRTLKLSNGQVLDEGLIVVFEAGQSFTGEQSAEWHLHGSIAVQRTALDALSSEEGLRPAEAGEFTRRALENERLDLGQIEGLADLIDAETEMQRRRALMSLGGELAKKVDTWRADLVKASALLEATIDFADEDVPDDLSADVLRLISTTQVSIEDELIGSVCAERIRTGFEVAIIGPPNAGKSTLLNRLAGREAAITSSIAGTTRDVIEVKMDIAGLPVTLLDTAGLRETDDPVERIGVERAQDRAAAADIRIRLSDTTDLGSEGDIELKSKIDDAAALSEGISGKTGAGVDELIGLLGARLSKRTQTAGVFDRARHQIAAKNAIEALERARLLLEGREVSFEQPAEDLRLANRALESLIGRVDVENLLDDIFSSFCIGK
ncbi:MAG: tRNA uridine-5-carboxymethylaminomethyl(34) synthesis GTPase MnmE [Pseudomonadota bacterium]